MQDARYARPRLRLKATVPFAIAKYHCAHQIRGCQGNGVGAVAAVEALNRSRNSSSGSRNNVFKTAAENWSLQCLCQHAPHAMSSAAVRAESGTLEAFVAESVVIAVQSHNCSHYSSCSERHGTCRSSEGCGGRKHSGGTRSEGKHHYAKLRNA